MNVKHNTNRIKTAAGAVLAVIFLMAVLTIFVSQIYLICTLRMPKTFREMTMIKYAVDFSKGINPYAKELLGGDLPFNSGCYGCLQALLTGLLLKAVSVKNALPAAELLSLAFDVSAALFLYLMLTGRKCERWIALFSVTVAALIFFQCGAAYPHSIGMLLTFLLVCLIDKDGRKDKYRPLLYAVLVILSFYAKQYFILSAPCVFIYLLIRSPKDALKLAIYGVVIGPASLLLINFIFPLYLPLTLVRANIDSNMDGLRYVAGQIFEVYFKKYPVVTLFAAAGIAGWTANRIGEMRDSEKSAGESVLALLKAVPYEGVALVLSVIPVAMISRNRGQFCEYFEQLTVPYACLIACMTADALWKIRKKGTFRKIIPYITAAAALFAGYMSISRTVGKVVSLDYGHFLESRTETERILDEYAPEHRIIVTSLLADYCMVRDIYTDDYGQAQYNSETAMKRLKDKPMYDRLFPAMGEIIQMTLDYREDVQKKINEGYYEVLVLNSDDKGSMNCKNLKVSDKHYALHDEKVLPTVYGRFKVRTYIRK